MPVLKSSPASPFGRKVKIAVSLAGLSDSLTVETADTTNPNDPLRIQNPLGKIPTLVLDDGETLFDSRVIVEWVDERAGGGVVIPKGPERFAALRMQALADGILDAALLQVYEGRFRDESRRDPKWVAYQQEKVDRALTTLEASPPAIGERPHIGPIALACALGYLDLRFEGRWRASYPKLVSWLDAFAARVPAFEDTRFKG
ncbi:glutathione S-transferase family protein [uncultured Alsobacter sp.]|uniref:glutathione S-transferase family protein n=1 Tax=uncultured Alsobacter sp. TaxID=1748258 RepID=UPI0025EC83BD|nr:glutathione S-transferase family protein [uncultured Alsobacter sp.]